LGDRWSEQLSERQIEILKLIIETSKISRKKLSEILNINPSAIQKHIGILKKLNIIKRAGTAKGGYWEGIIKNRRRSYYREQEIVYTLAEVIFERNKEREVSISIMICRGGSYLAVCGVAPHSHSYCYAHSSRLASNPNMSLQSVKDFLLSVVKCCRR